MERLCFDERDASFNRTTATPRLPPPVLGRDGKITFPQLAGFGERASRPYVPPAPTQARMQFVPAGSSPAQPMPAPAEKPSVRVDISPHQSGQDGSQPPTPRTPTTPQTPGTPLTPRSPGEHWGQNSEAADDAHPPRSPEMPPDADGGHVGSGDMEDAASFAPGAEDDDAGNFAPGADYAELSQHASSSGYAAGDYAPVDSPQVQCRRSGS